MKDRKVEWVLSEGRNQGKGGELKEKAGRANVVEILSAHV
jgi:hypothetical protein